MSYEYTPVFYYNFTNSYETYELEQVNKSDISRDDRGLTIRNDKYTTHTNPNTFDLTTSSKLMPDLGVGTFGLLDHVKSLTFLSKSYKVYNNQDQQSILDAVNIKSKDFKTIKQPITKFTDDFQSQLRDRSQMHPQRDFESQGEFIYEACMSAQQIINPGIVPSIYRSRIRNIHEDYRLCSSALVIYDEETMIVVRILFTDDWIYGNYERCPGHKTGWSQNNLRNLGDYAAFSSIIPLCKRGNSNPFSKSKLDDFTRVGIGIDSDRGTIKFYVNRIEMFCIPRIGHRLADEYQVSELGGTSYQVTVERMKLGFGHFSFLDHNIPNNYSRQYVLESLDSNNYPIHRSASGLAQLLPTNMYREPYPDFTGEYTSIDPNISFAYSGSDPDYFIFGQGMITRIKYIAAYIVNTKFKLHKMLCNDVFPCNKSSQNVHISDAPNNDECDSSEYGGSSVETDDRTTGDILRTMNHKSSHLQIRSKIVSQYDSRPEIPLFHDRSIKDTSIMMLKSEHGKQNQTHTDIDDSKQSYSLSDLYKRSRRI